MNDVPKTVFAKVGENHDLIVVNQFHGVGQVSVLTNLISFKFFFMQFGVLRLHFSFDGTYVLLLSYIHILLLFDER